MLQINDALKVALELARYAADGCLRSVAPRSASVRQRSAQTRPILPSFY
jgi:hypothetical protein